MFESFFNTVHTNPVKGDDRPSFSATLIHASGTVSFLSVAGAESTSAVMAWFTLVAELDAVVGRTRLPSFADYAHLPYIHAMVKEVLRWRPADPVAFPHRSTEDDWSMAKMRIISILRDILTQMAELCQDCPTQRKKVDGFVEDGLLVRPVPYECDITPRFPEASVLLAQELELHVEMLHIWGEQLRGCVIPGDRLTIVKIKVMTCKRLRATRDYLAEEQGSPTCGVGETNMSETNILLTRDPLAGLIIFSKMVKSGVKTSSIDISHLKYDSSSSSTPEAVGSQARAS
ncbi:hypothetical protein BC827DRAFT_1153899 [Russula dissimulans]|nr:hypothetical protein BC827DRAFT_1153899 [Russula dissimulans]